MAHPVPMPPFEERARQGLTDERLRLALGGASRRFLTEREKAIQLLPDPQGLRQRGRAIREHTIAHLDQFLTQLEASVQGNGGHVHWARDAEEACHLIVGLISQAEGQRIVKSKSMLTEEIGLNHALVAAGLEVTETDLGEWIVQLAGETPSHIIAPAVHKTKDQVAALLEKETGQSVPDEIPAMTSLARRIMREKFLAADVGISGVNFAIAESGTLVLVTNEGNGRMVTSLPRLHIAVMGLEKVVPTWEDASVLLSLLTRSATGQLITSYVTALSGPRRPDEFDGPEELHLVIVDAGRTRILESNYRESLYCIRCGACINACPVYGVIGGHAYGWTYPGPIGAVQTPLFKGLDDFGALPHASSLCGACKDVCPVVIDLPKMLLALRAQEVAEKQVPWYERTLAWAFGWAISRPTLYILSGRIGSLLLRPLARQGWLRSVPLPIINRWTRARDFPAPAPLSFRARWRKRQQTSVFHTTEDGRTQ